MIVKGDFSGVFLLVAQLYLPAHRPPNGLISTGRGPVGTLSDSSAVSICFYLENSVGIYLRFSIDFLSS